MTRSPPPTAATATWWPRAVTSKAMYAELFGRITGYCKGKGGSMHISDLTVGMLGANGIVVGAGPPIVGGGGVLQQVPRHPQRGGHVLR